MLLNKGSQASLGVVILFWVVCCLGVIGAPPTLNLWVEIMSFFVRVGRGSGAAKRLMASAFVTGAYSLILASRVMSFNRQFAFSDKGKITIMDTVHATYSSLLLVFLVFIIPAVSVL